MNKRLTRENSINIIEQAERTEAEFADCFTAAVSGESMQHIYKVDSFSQFYKYKVFSTFNK